jgi:hypothetical protein
MQKFYKYVFFFSLDFCTVLRARFYCFLTSRFFRGMCWKTAVIILVCLWALSPRTASGQIFSAPTAVDFGSLTCTSGVVTRTVVVRNSGLAPLTISGAAVSPTNANFKNLKKNRIASEYLSWHAALFESQRYPSDSYFLQSCAYWFH